MSRHQTSSEGSRPWLVGATEPAVRGGTVVSRRLVALAGVAVVLAGLASPASGSMPGAPPDSSSARASGQWHPAGRVLGRVLGRLNGGQVLVCRGDDGGFRPGPRQAWLYLPRAERWVRTGDLKAPGGCGTGSVAPLPKGKVLLAGGLNRVRLGARLRRAQVYHPATGRWVLTAAMHERRDEAAVARLRGGQVLVAGGYGPFLANPQRSAEIYHPRTRTWSVTASMRVPRAGASAALLPDGDVLVVGGDGGWDSSERYDVRTRTWQPPVRLTDAGLARLAVLPSGRVLAVGTGPRARGVDVYLPASDRWISQPTLPRAWRYAPLATVHGLPMVIGGAAGRERSPRYGCRASTYQYRPATGAWIPRAPLPMGRCGFTVATLRDGSVLLVGGYSDSPAAPQRYVARAIRFIPRAR